ncbi:hypothetical protein QL285_058679 [Trifolium repens]|nr:hypothetical protein QL285_058679 [Trifolium repens]
MPPTPRSHLASRVNNNPRRDSRRLINLNPYLYTVSPVHTISIVWLASQVRLTSFKDIPCVSQSSYSQGKGAVGFEKSIHYTTNEAYTIDRRR